MANFTDIIDVASRLLEAVEGKGRICVLTYIELEVTRAYPGTI